MLTHQRKPVCLSLISTDLPIWSVVETAATLYQKDSEVPLTIDRTPFRSGNPGNSVLDCHPRLLWLEISPYRVIMTHAGNGQVSYRHSEKGIYQLLLVK